MFGAIRKFFSRAAMPLPSVDDLSEPGSKLCDKQNKYVLYHWCIHLYFFLAFINQPWF